MVHALVHVRVRHHLTRTVLYCTVLYEYLGYQEVLVRVRVRVIVSDTVQRTDTVQYNTSTVPLQYSTSTRKF